jgi:hypothetical protein
MRPRAVWPEEDRLHRRAAQLTLDDPLWRPPFAPGGTFQPLADELSEDVASRAKTPIAESLVYP